MAERIHEARACESGDEGRAHRPVAAARICVACRSLLVRGEVCSCGAASLAPASPAGWTALTNAVWGEAGPALPATLRPSLPKASFIPLLPLAGIVLLGKSSLLSLWASAPGEALAAPAPWLLGGSLLWLLGTLVITPLLVWLVMRASTRA